MSYIEWIRGKVGTRKIFLAFASVVLWDENGRLLLQQRGDFDMWGLPGGVLERDEDLLTCARRELLEETGLKAGALSLVGIFDRPHYDVVYPNGDQVQQFTVCFQGQAAGGKLQIDGIETRDLRFVTPAEAAEMRMAIWYSDMIRDACINGVPTFAPPFRHGQTVDQVAAVRPFIGKELYIGIGATVLVTREDGRILILKHVGETDWRFPAGFADLGETLAATAVREMREETGLHIQPDRIVAIYSAQEMHNVYPNGDQVKNVGVLFHARYTGGTIQLDAGEIEQMAWIDASQLLEWVDPQKIGFYTAVLAHLEKGYVVY